MPGAPITPCSSTGNPAGVVEAKPESWGQKITTVEEQSGRYAAASLKWVDNQAPLPFVYESTGALTRFTDGRDPRPRSREVFSFPRPDTMRGLAQPARIASITPQDSSRAGHRGTSQVPDQGHPESGRILQRRPPPRTHPDGHRVQARPTLPSPSIYRLLKHADAKRVSISRGYPKPRRTGRTGVHGLRGPTTTTESSPNSTTSSASHRHTSPTTVRSASAPSSGCTRCSRAAS